jgi:hypothetical protein
MAKTRFFIIATLVALILGTIVGCGTVLESSVTMRCGEAQTISVKKDRCVEAIKNEGACPIRVTVQCPGQAEKTTMVRGEDAPGKLCCPASLGTIKFEAVGKGSGECKFTYKRTD